MSSKKTMRVVLDAALTVMIVFEMFIQFTGEFLHEIIGFAFFATILAHLLLSAKWIKNTARNASRGEMNRRRKILALMGVLLAINIIVLAVSSVAISNLLAGAGFVWTLGSYATWATIHAVSSYSLCALVALHLGMHWIFLASALHIPYDPARRRAIGAGVNTVATLGAIALGVMAVSEVIPASANTNSANQATGNGTSSNGTSGGGTTSSSSGTNSTRPPVSKGKAGTAPTGSSTSTSTQNSDGSSNTTSNDSAGSANAGSAAATGICTLCRKQCPLSAPQCNKPYEAGLI